MSSVVVVEPGNVVKPQLHLSRNQNVFEYISHAIKMSLNGLSIFDLIMRRLNRNVNPPPSPSSRASPGHLTIFCALGVGNLICKAFSGVGI